MSRSWMLFEIDRLLPVQASVYAWYFEYHADRCESGGTLARCANKCWRRGVSDAESTPGSTQR